jgi:hypothetical protein
MSDISFRVGRFDNACLCMRAGGMAGRAWRGIERGRARASFELADTSLDDLLLDLLLGIFVFVTAQVLGTFEDGFTEMRLEALKNQTLFSRIGFISAFVLLDLDMREVRLLIMDSPGFVT